MALTKVTGGILSQPIDLGITTATTGFFSGIVTAQSVRVLGDLTVDGSTTTLDTVVTEVDRIEVDANSDTIVGVAITQSGTADILNLYDGSNKEFSVVDGGTVKISQSMAFQQSDRTTTAGLLGRGSLLLAGTQQTDFAIRSNPHNSNLILGVGVTERLRIMSSGAIGIHTTTGTNTVNIGGATGLGVKFHNFTSGNSSYVTVESGDELRSNVGGSGYYTWVTGGSEKVRITSAGNVGINSTIPQAKLDVYANNISGGGLIHVTQDGTGDAAIDFQLVGTREYSLGIDNSDSDKFKLSGSAGLANDNLITFTHDGNVGIGTDNPKNTLEVVGVGITVFNDAKNASVDIGNGKIELARTDSVAYIDFKTGLQEDFDCRIQQFSNGLRFYTGGQGNTDERLRITSAGNVGIGTVSPGTKLEVNQGSILVDAFNTSGDQGLFFRKGFTDANSNSYNLSILAYDHSGSNKDGLSINAYDGISFSTGSNTRDEKVRITSGGQVGIGTDLTTTPSSTLTIAPHNSTQGRNISIYTSGTVGNKAGLFFNSTSGTGNLAEIQAEYKGTNEGELVLSTSMQKRITIQKGGNVGIGTDDPQEILHITQTGNPKILIEDTDSSNQVGVRFKTTTQDWIAGLHGGISTFKISKNNAFGVNDYFNIIGSGNVGINSATPATKLDVNGSFQVKDSTGKLSMQIDGANGVFKVFQSPSSWTNLTYTPSPILAWDYKNGSGPGDLMYMASGGHTPIATQMALVISDNHGFKVGRAGYDGTDFDVSPTAEWFRIAKDGFVGIGTNSPQTKLHLRQDTDDNTDGFRISRSNSNASYSQYIDTGARFNIGYSNPSTADPSPQITLDQNGNVGINSTLPAVRLDVFKAYNGLGAGNAAARIYGTDSGVAETGVRFVEKGTNLHTSSTSYLMRGISNGATQFVFGANGNVGIGTNNPSSKLTIRDLTGGQSLLIEGSGGNDVAVLGSVNGATNRGELIIKEGTTGSEYIKLTSRASTPSFIMFNNLGIGTDNPDQKLHVMKDSAGTVTSDGNAVITLENSNHSILHILTPSNKSGRIMFGSPDDNTAGQIIYDHNANPEKLTFTVGGTTRVAINTEGNLTLTSGSGTQFKGLQLVKADGGTVAQLVGHGSDNDGGGLNLWNDDTKKIQILANGSSYLNGGNVGINSTVPTAKLEVYAQGNSEKGIRLLDSNDSQSAPYIEVIGKRSDGNSSQGFGGKIHLAKNYTNDKINNGNILGTVAFGGNHTDGTEANILYTASISAVASDSFDSATDMPTDLIFLTGPTGKTPTAVNTTTGTEKLRITSDGDIYTSNDQVRDNARLTLTKNAVGISTILFLMNGQGSSTGSKISANKNLILCADAENNSNAAQSNLIFETKADEKVRITSAGSVGIGTNNPTQKLEVKYGEAWIDNNSGDSIARSDGLTVSHAPSSDFTIGSDPGDSLRTATFAVKGASRAAIVSLRNIDDNSAFWDFIVDGNTNKFYIQRAAGNAYRGSAVSIDANLNVGIGTDNPSKALHVDGTIFASGATTSLDGGLRIQPNNDGTNYGGVIYGGAHNDNNHAIFFRRGYDGTINTIDINSYGMFRVFTNGSLASQDERLRITSSGTVGVNCTPTAAPLEVKQLSADGGALRLRDSSAQYRYLEFDVTGALTQITARSNNSHGSINIGTIDQFGRTTQLYIKGGANAAIGIGTDNPTELLDVYKTSNDAVIKTRTTTAGAYFEADSAAAAGYFGLKLSSSGTGKWFVGSYNSANFQIKDGTIAGGAERFTIQDSTGNIGVSQVNPLKQLDVVGNILVRPTTTTTLHSSGNADAVNNSIIVRMPYGENAASTSNAGARFGIQFTGANNTTDHTSLNFADDPRKSASIYGVSEDTATGYSRSVGLAFYTSGFDATQEERLRISSDGVVQLNLASNSHIRGGVYAKYKGDGTGNTANINTSTAGKISWLPTSGITQIFGNGGFTNTATDVTIPKSGIYQITLNAFIRSNTGTAAANQRTNVIFRFRVNGNDQIDQSANNYIRGANVHHESSVNFTAYLSLSAGNTVAVSSQQESPQGGDVFLVKERSTLTFHLVA